MKNRRYWSSTRAVGTYVTARVSYNMVMALWRGPGRYIVYLCVGYIVVRMLG